MTEREKEQLLFIEQAIFKASHRLSGANNPLLRAMIEIMNMCCALREGKDGKHKYYKKWYEESKVKFTKLFEQL